MTATASSVSEQDQAAAAEANRSPNDPPTPPRDKPPRPRTGGKGGKRAGAGRPKGSKNKEPRPPSKSQADAALRESLGQLLALPVIPAAMFASDVEDKEFLTGHFIATAGPTAEQLVELSKQSPELRLLLEKITTASVGMSLVMLGVGYLAPPALWVIGRRGEAMALEQISTSSPEQLAAAQMEMARMQAQEEAYAQEAEALRSQGGQPTPETQAADAARAAFDAARAARQQTA
jgi:hypothetical protein